MRPDDILISVPTRGSVRWETVTALEAARDYLGQGALPILYQQGTLSVALTRNRIVRRFLKTDREVLAMVDDDIAPPINFVEMLAPHLELFGMVALPHPAPHPSEPETMCFTAYDATVEGDLRPTGLWPGINEVDAAATGCVLIRRDVFERMGATPFRITNDPDAPVQSDDLLFCADLREAGFKVGVFWEGHLVDHFQAVSLAPLAEAQLGIENKSHGGLIVVGERNRP